MAAGSRAPTTTPAPRQPSPAAPQSSQYHDKPVDAILRLGRHIRFYSFAKGWIKHPNSKDKAICKKDIAAFLKSIQGQQFSDPKHHCFRDYPHSGDLRHSCSYWDDFKMHQSDSFKAALDAVKGIPKITATLAEIYRNELGRTGGERPAVTAALQVMEDVAADLVDEVTSNQVLKCTTLAEVAKMIGRKPAGPMGWIATRNTCSVSTLPCYSKLESSDRVGQSVEMPFVGKV